MFAIIDSGTTNTRVYIINDKNEIVAEGSRKVGVRNTSMTGSNAVLKAGVAEAVDEAAANAGIALSDLEFAIASGMITSEIGLLEIPHLVAPVGLEQLADGVRRADGKEAVGIDLPILFIRGIRNNYGDGATMHDINNVDFMRGEETQIMGILEEYGKGEPMNVVVLSSHTKLIHVSAAGLVESSFTTMSGQLYEAILNQTNVGVSLSEREDEESGGYSFEEIVTIAEEVVGSMGLDRCMIIPRFMQVLLKTDYKERQLFVDASIAADDMKGVVEFHKRGCRADTYILFGHKSRCRLYAHMIRKHFKDNVDIIQVSDKNKLSELTVRGAIRIANTYREKIKRGDDQHV